MDLTAPWYRSWQHLWSKVTRLNFLEWESKSAMLASLRPVGVRVVIVGEDAEAPREYYTFSMAEVGLPLKIAVISSGLGSQPAALLLRKIDRAVVGYDCSLAWIDTVTASNAATTRLNGVFFEFLPTGSDEEIVVIHELGAIRLKKDGAEVWFVDTDIVEGFTLDQAGNLLLAVADQAAKLHVEMTSGRVSKAV